MANVSGTGSASATLSGTTPDVVTINGASGAVQVSNTAGTETMWVKLGSTDPGAFSAGASGARPIPSGRTVLFPGGWGIQTVARVVGNGNSYTIALVERQRGAQLTVDDDVTGAVPVSVATNAVSQKWQRAIARRETTPIDIVVVGDSISEGATLATIGERWSDLLLAQLRRDLQPTSVVGGDGFIPAYYQTSGPTDAWARTGSPVEGTAGFGLRSLTLTVAGAEIATLTATGTAFDIFYSTEPGGVAQVSIDGGAYSDMAGTADADTTQRHSITGLADASHTVAVRTKAATATTHLHGAMVYRGDESRGVRMWNASRGSSHTNTYGTASAFAKWDDALAIIDPDLVIIALGVNDAVFQSPASYSSTLTTLIQNIKTAMTDDPTIVVLITNQRDQSSILAPNTWDMYRASALAVAQANGCACIDVTDQFGPLLSAYGLVDSDGNLHPNEEGHRLYADVLYGALAGERVQPIVPKVRTARKTANTVRNNTDVLASDPHLFIPLDANSVYALDGFLVYTGQQTADFKIQWSVPTGATMYWSGRGAAAGATSSTGSITYLGNLESQAITLGGLTTRSVARPVGVITTGAISGALILQWAQGTAEVSDLTLLAGSYIMVRDIT